MQTRKLGQFEVSAIGLGCMSMSQASYGTPDPVESARALKHALDIGYTFFDTASIYGLGHNEIFIGNVLGPNRHEFILASKCGIDAGRDGKRYIDSTPDNIKRTCESSLKRLQTDVIDLYYLHRQNPEVPIEESVGALADLVLEGKIRSIGLSEITTETLLRAQSTHPITAVQSAYSLLTRPERRLLETCRKLEITFIASSPLDRALLTGNIRNIDHDLDNDDLRRTMPRFHKSNFNNNLLLLNEFNKIADANNCTMAQLALAWLLAQEDGNLIPIPGTKHLKYVEENVNAVNLKIKKDDLNYIETILNPESISGDRYSPNSEVPVDGKAGQK